VVRIDINMRIDINIGIIADVYSGLSVLVATDSYIVL